MIEINVYGGFEKTLSFLKRMSNNDHLRGLERYGQKGVEALQAATPKDTGATAYSWDYRIVKDRSGLSIEWFNTNTPNGVQVAILLQYGHGTGTGGYVQGRDYINPATQPIFDQILEDMWREVQNA